MTEICEDCGCIEEFHKSRKHSKRCVCKKFKAKNPIVKMANIFADEVLKPQREFYEERGEWHKPKNHSPQKELENEGVVSQRSPDSFVPQTDRRCDLARNQKTKVAPKINNKYGRTTEAIEAINSEAGRSCQNIPVETNSPKTEDKEPENPVCNAIRNSGSENESLSDTEKYLTTSGSDNHSPSSSPRTGLACAIHAEDKEPEALGLKTCTSGSDNHSPKGATRLRDIDSTRHGSDDESLSDKIVYTEKRYHDNRILKKPYGFIKVKHVKEFIKDEKARRSNQLRIHWNWLQNVPYEEVVNFLDAITNKRAGKGLTNG